jgi:RNA polymerase sigma-70 factor (ECF subfamily)
MDAAAIADLLTRCQAGDRAAWDVLVDQYWRRLFGFALRATGSAEVAQDLVQETFLRIVQRLGKYDDRGKFEAWLFRILVNLIRDQGRAKTRRRTQSTTVDKGGQRGDLTDDIANTTPLPPTVLEQSEDAQRLREAIGKLSETDRQILLLRHEADMPFKDIAKVLNCPIGTVLARAHRALGKLRVLMEVETHD